MQISHSFQKKQICFDERIRIIYDFIKKLCNICAVKIT